MPFPERGYFRAISSSSCLPMVLGRPAREPLHGESAPKTPTAEMGAGIVSALPAAENGCSIQLLPVMLAGSVDLYAQEDIKILARRIPGPPRQ